MTLLQDVYADEPTLSSSAQIESDNNIEANEPAIIMHNALPITVHAFIISRFITNFYLQPSPPPLLRPPLV